MSSSSILRGHAYAKEPGADRRLSVRTWYIIGAALACTAPFLLGDYGLNLVIQIGYFAIAALGLNLLVGCTGQISIGHAGFFGFGAFCSAWLSHRCGVPVLLAMPLSALATSLLGLLVGVPAARIGGLYLAISTLAAQYVLQDFFARAAWLTGGSAGTIAPPADVFGLTLNDDRRYVWLVLGWLLVTFVMAGNLLRTRRGRALIAVRDHHLAAAMMGINLAHHRILAFGLAAFLAGLGGALYGHHLGFVSIEGFTVLMSVEFLAMVIMGGPGSVVGTLLGTAVIVLLPEVMGAAATALRGSWMDARLHLHDGLPHLREMAIGAAIILLLRFAPDGLARCWRLPHRHRARNPHAFETRNANEEIP